MFESLKRGVGRGRRLVGRAACGRVLALVVLALLVAAGLAAPEADPYVQQATLVGTGASGSTPQQGWSGKLSTP